MASPSPSPVTVSQVAVNGFHNAKAYDTHRPSYPAEAVDSLLRELGIAGRRGARIVEVGAGTGKFTELLAARDEGYHVLAVEPLASMREQLAGKNLPRVEVLEGAALSLPVDDGWGDACIVAQAFHWFANQEALRELRRVLKPGSSLGVAWNIEDYNKPASWEASTPWEQKLNELIHGLELDGQPRFRDDKWRDGFLSQPSEGNKEPFVTPIGEKVFRWAVWLSEEALWLRMSTLSQVAVLQGTAKAEYTKRFKEILSSPDVARNAQGHVELHGVTFYAWTKRSD